ncbi:hypothetical protein [Limibacterium fermenti]|uniref:hypothetical protein n=1 Tax=Limibacterium fermenti TaxID=3229863 RepID=UPI003A5EB57D
MRKLVYVLVAVFVCISCQNKQGTNASGDQSEEAPKVIDYSNVKEKSFSELFTEIEPNQIKESPFDLFPKINGVVTAGDSTVFNSMVIGDGALGQMIGKYVTIFYKEWVKTHKAILLIAFVFVGFIAYTFINVSQMFRINGAVQTWFNVIVKDITLLGQMQWLPLLAGMLLALSQYVPEMVDKRLKLTLHLPLPERKIMWVMMAYGAAVLVTLFVLTYLILALWLGIYYPREIVVSAVWASLPWFLAGLTAYFCVAWISLEPVWRQRIGDALIAVCLLSLFFFNAKSGAYVPFVFYGAAIVVAVSVLPLYSMFRFKDGVQ